jgi:hypothetical protein
MTRIRLIFAALALALIAFLTLPTAAFADAAVPITSDSNSLAQVRISPFLMTLVVAQVLPLVTGYLTTLRTPSWVKGLITLALNAVSAVLASAVMVGGFYVITKETAITVLLAFVASHVSYSSVLKKARLTSSLVDVHGVEVEGALANVGVK